MGFFSRYRILAQPLFALILACILAAHHAAGFTGPNTAFAEYGYWVLRISIQISIISAASTLLSNSIEALQSRPITLTILAVIASHPFYVTMVTMLDMLLGLPEFNAAEWEKGLLSRLYLICNESLFLLDNHFAVAFLLRWPAIAGAASRESDAVAQSTFPTSAQAIAPLGVRSSPLEIADPIAVAEPDQPPAFLAEVSPQLTGPVLLVEAQEHYIRVHTPSGHGMALYTFKKALRDLEPYHGLQVHRSWWIADISVVSVEKRTNGYALKTTLDEVIPVSRRFEKAVLERFRDCENQTLAQELA